MRHSEESAHNEGALANSLQSEGQQQLASTAFLKNTWYVVGWSSEFAGIGPFARTVASERLVLFRTRNGKITAFEDRCPHRLAPLSLGRVEDDDLRCMYHGLKFAANGTCIEVPGQDRVAKSLCTRTYSVAEKYQFVWIWMGDPRFAEVNLIPDVSVLDQPDRRPYRGHLDYQANYALINDNLLDLSHLEFLHQRTLGRAPETVRRSRGVPRVPGGGQAKSLGNGVRVEGWLGANSVFVPERARQGDLWSRVDFVVPGIYIASGGVFPAGTAENLAGNLPQNTNSMIYNDAIVQAVTPITLRKSRYFYCLAPLSSDVNVEESDAIWSVILEAFSEDLRMIEAQQVSIDSCANKSMGGIAADRGLVMFRALMKKLISREVSGGGSPNTSGATS